MATLHYTTAGSVQTLSAASFLVLGNADDTRACAWIVELRPAAATYSVTFKGRAQVRTASGGTTGGIDPVTGDAAVAYTDLTTGTTTTGATALTGTTSSAAKLYRVTADGLTIAVDVGTLSAGTLDVVAFPVLTAA